MWFVEERGFDGGWKPAIYHGRHAPSEQRADSARRKFRAAPANVNRGHAHLPLAVLATIYGVDGQFRGTGRGGSTNTMSAAPVAASPAGDSSPHPAPAGVNSGDENA